MKPKDVQRVTNLFLNFQQQRGTAVAEKDINNGSCFNWALLAYRLYGGRLCTVDSFDGHAFIKIRRKYYDSETLNGVIDWRQLKGMKYAQPQIFDAKFYEMTLMSLRRFCAYWKSNGADTLYDIYLSPPPA